MSCPNCNHNLLNGVFYCDTNDYRVIDNLNDRNLIFIIEIHEIEDDNEEIGDNQNIQYCNQQDCRYLKFPED